MSGEDGMSEEARGIFRLARTLRAEEVLAEELERRYAEADAKGAISIARERREKRGEEKFKFFAHHLSNPKCAVKYFFRSRMDLPLPHQRHGPLPVGPRLLRLGGARGGVGAVEEVEPDGAGQP